LLLVAVVLLGISSWGFEEARVGAGVGFFAGGVVAGYLGWRVLGWPSPRGRWREVSEFSGVSLRERMVVFVLDWFLFFLLILIVGWDWALAISAGVFALWVWLANRSGE
jgi:hypothetical protein